MQLLYVFGQNFSTLGAETTVLKCKAFPLAYTLDRSPDELATAVRRSPFTTAPSVAPTAANAPDSSSAVDAALSKHSRAYSSTGSERYPEKFLWQDSNTQGAAGCHPSCNLRPYKHHLRCLCLARTSLAMLL